MTNQLKCDINRRKWDISKSNQSSRRNEKRDSRRIGNIIGIENSSTDNWVGLSKYLAYNHIYTTKALYDAIGDGSWKNQSGGQNWEAIEGTEEQIKAKMITNLLKGKRKRSWKMGKRYD